MFRKLLMSTAFIVGAMGAASAADLPSRKAPPAYMPPPLPIFTWTGVYVGAQIGYQWGTSTTGLAATAGGPVVIGLPNYSPSGVVGGAHIGYNYQIGPLVAGLEGEVDGTNYKGGNTVPGFTYGTREDIEGSIRGRLGYAFDHALIYATGGAAFAGLKNTYTGVGGVFDGPSKTRVGWTVGGGLEYAIDNNWSVRGEYRYTDYGTYSDFLPNNGGFFAKKHETDNRVTVGFSYKFDLMGSAPVFAKY